MIFVLLSGCLKEVDLESISFDSLLVVEAILNDTDQQQRVTVSRTTTLGGESAPPGESGAEVWIESATDGRVDFFEDDSEPGTYLTSGTYAGIVGETYQLFIRTQNGQMYQSDPVEMLATPEIDSIYAEFEPSPTQDNRNGGFFHFFVDSRSNPANNRFYRWTWNSTFELTVPNPSRWLWTGGNTFVNRDLGGINDSLQVEECWVHDSSSQVLVTELLEGTESITAQPIHTFHSDNRAMRIRYSIEVKQYAISPESYEYWNLISEFTQKQGFLFDKQVGTITGNIQNTTNSDEPVLGIFEATQERTVRRFYLPADFVEEGFRRQFRTYVNCSDLDPLQSTENEIAEIMEEYGDSYTICFFITTGPPNIVVYHLHTCADCTLYGENKRPSFW